MKTILNIPPSPVQEITSSLLREKKIRLWIKRDDLLHPLLGGNKWRKLKYNLQQAGKEEQNQLLTFGGAFSNHIFATAAAGKVFGFQTIGVIRGEETRPLNPTLEFALQSGMQLHFVSRQEYKKKNLATYIRYLNNLFGDSFFIPEGGTNNLAINGCMEIVAEVDRQLSFLPDYWCAACGTGGTLGGIVAGLKGRKKVLGFSALKGDFLKDEIDRLLQNRAAVEETPFSEYTVNSNYHFGGYARFKPALIAFINDFYSTYKIRLDPIYTGKLFFGIFDLLKKDFFTPGSSILAVHTGGLQGIAGFNQRHGPLIKEEKAKKR